MTPDERSVAEHQARMDALDPQSRPHRDWMYWWDTAQQVALGLIVIAGASVALVWLIGAVIGMFR